MRNLQVRVLTAALGLACASAFAGVPSEGPEGTGDSYAAAAAIGVGGDATATGGTGGEGGDAHASAAGGAGGSASATQSQVAEGGAGGAGGDASNLGNAQHVTINHRRNAPSLAQGGLAVSGCGSGVNGGGSRTGGAGFFGLVWTTEQCYALLAAEHFAAIGMPDTSCDLLVSMESVQKAFKRAGKPLPDCATAENRDLTSASAELVGGLAAIERMKPPAEVTCDQCATKEELARAFKQAHSK